MNNRYDRGRMVYRVPQSAAAPACGCRNETSVETEQNLPVMAYVPQQEYGTVYNECQALRRGTLFPALDKPFGGKGCR